MSARTPTDARASMADGDSANRARVMAAYWHVKTISQEMADAFANRVFLLAHEWQQKAEQSIAARESRDVPNPVGLRVVARNGRAR